MSKLESKIARTERALANEGDDDKEFAEYEAQRAAELADYEAKRAAAVAEEQQRQAAAAAEEKARKAKLAKELAARAADFKKGDKVKLSASGCEAPEDYDWSRDAMQPGDVGIVLSARVVDEIVDVFLKGPSGRTDSYSAVDLLK